MIFASLFFVAAAAAVAQVACSSDSTTAPPPAPSATPVVPDSGTFSFGDTTKTRTVAITGAGTVVSGATSDSGPQAVNCTSDGTTTTGACTAQYQDTLYQTAANGWLFDHWDPGASTSSTYYIGQASPDTITAVFVKDKTPIPPVVDSGPTPDTGTPDTSTPDTGTPDTGTDASDSGHD
jgi:hypothetical protein